MHTNKYTPFAEILFQLLTLYWENVPKFYNLCSIPIFTLSKQRITRTLIPLCKLPIKPPVKYSWIRTEFFLRKIQKMHLSPENDWIDELMVPSEGAHQELSNEWSRQYISTILYFWGKFLCPALGDRSHQQSLTLLQSRHIINQSYHCSGSIEEISQHFDDNFHSHRTKISLWGGNQQPFRVYA
jgi:hypothetical protein